ncbi:MAG: DnaB helicase C-terminal domain-containing protein, partial [Thermaerobacter sp.]|nr:DnaB helicase C-terminal domain-containing protein [Thermaerobacter sp.]
VTSLDTAAEGATLAAMLADDGFRVEVLCEPEDLFGDARYAVLRRAVGALTERGDLVDALTVAREAQALGLDSAENVVRGLPPASGKYLMVLSNARLRRKAQEIGRMLMASGASPEADLGQAAELAVAALAGTKSKVISAGDAGAEAFRKVKAGAPRIVRTGIPELDDALQLVGPGDLVIVGARPSRGKTAAAVQVARYTAAAGTGVLFGSLEMAPEQISLRLVAQEAIVPFVALAANQLEVGGWQKAARALETISTLPLSIADAGGYTPAQIRAAATKFKAALARKGISLSMILVDYLQIVTPPRPDRNRDREIAAISAALKSLAKGLDVVVIGLSQLSRAVEGRQDKRPALSDLRESGAIEQDADTVILLHRPEKSEGVAEMIIAKQRNGPTGTIRTVWNGPSMVFEPVGDAFEAN